MVSRTFNLHRRSPHLLRNTGIQEHILKQEEYKQVVKKLIQASDFNLKLIGFFTDSDALNKKTQKFNNTVSELLLQGDCLDSQKVDLVKNLEACDNIKSRFKMNSLISSIDHEIRRLQDYYSSRIEGKVGVENFYTDLAQFKMSREKYYKLTIMRQKLNEQISK